MQLTTKSEQQTQREGEKLAEKLFASQPAFVRISGPLGAGKSAFSRGFIRKWLELAQDEAPESIVSPTYNIVKTYGTRTQLAHLDLYRVKNMRELEHLGFEQYFFEMSCCLVEWLEQVPEAVGHMPPYAIEIDIAFGKAADERTLTIQGPKRTS